MAPLVVLIVVTAIAPLAGQLGVAPLREWRSAARVGLAVMLATPRRGHFSRALTGSAVAVDTLVPSGKLSLPPDPVRFGPRGAPRGRLAFATGVRPDLIPFDKEGRCVGPRTLDQLLKAAQSERFSDVHIYSHGWNNVFGEALAHYTEFFTEFFALRPQAGIPSDAYRPLLVGIIWPSTALVSAAEEGPSFAATPPRRRAQRRSNRNSRPPGSWHRS